jgi:5-methylcytosine-specific restriction protein A
MIIDTLVSLGKRGEEMTMATYLLIWNPNRWTWEVEDVQRDIAQLEKVGHIEGFRWSAGTNYRQIEAGDRLFLIRLGSEPRGIFLSGFAKGYAYKAAHWDSSKSKRAWYVDVEVDVLLNPYDEKSILSYEELEAISTGQRWSPPASGERIKDEVAAKLEVEWEQLLAPDQSEEIAKVSQQVDDVTHGTVDEQVISDSEGRKRIVQHVSYERSQKNRREAIKELGTTCAVCAFNFDEFYGKDYAQGYIQIHHIKPLSEYEGEVDPETDLVPLCANCHAMAHKRRETVTPIEELKELIDKAKG